MEIKDIIKLLLATVDKPSTVIANELGVEADTVRRWRKGLSKPQPIHYEKIADYFGITVEQLKGDAPISGLKLKTPVEFRYDQELMDQVPPIIGDETRRMLDRRYPAQIAFRANEITEGLINERYRILYYTMLLEEKISAAPENNSETERDAD